MQIAIYDKDANKYITSKDKEAMWISITLKGKVLWDGVDMSDDLQIVLLPSDT